MPGLYPKNVLRSPLLCKKGSYIFHWCQFMFWNGPRTEELGQDWHHVWQSRKTPAGTGNFILCGMYPPPAPSSSPCRNTRSKQNQLLINEVLNTQALVQLPFSHKAARELLYAADCTWKARFTVLLEGHVTGYRNHLRSHSLNLHKVPECIQAVLFSLQNNCFVSYILCPLLEDGFVTLWLCG